MNKYILKILTILILSVSFIPVAHAKGETVRKERKAILKGNKLYDKKDYNGALNYYKNALSANATSAVAEYNFGLTSLQLGLLKGDSVTVKNNLEKGIQYLSTVAAMGKNKPKLASMANYNLGNMSFMQEDYQKAIEYYKQALRLNPEDNNARRNLRIAQLKLQNNKDDKSNKEKNKPQEQQENKDDKNDKNNQQQNNQQPENNEINNQTAQQILQAIENKENRTRAKLNASGANKQNNTSQANKNW